eukprot:COSAG02_NODE_720_length_18054_cov_23.121192_1_plen_77_part_10
MSGVMRCISEDRWIGRLSAFVALGNSPIGRAEQTHTQKAKANARYVLGWWGGGGEGGRGRGGVGGGGGGGEGGGGGG